MKKIIIIGFAACYKSTAGKQLAEKLGYNFVDTDVEIECASGMSIRQIFDASGEAYFRKLESELLRSLKTRTDTVVSCGGGSILADDFDEFAQDSVVVWLTASAETVHARLGDSPRPLFDGQSVKQLSEYIQSRADLYKKYAQVEISTDGKTFEQVVQQMYTWLYAQNYIN